MEKEKTIKPSFFKGLMEFLKKYSVIGLAIGVFFMRRWAHRRRQARSVDPN